MSFSKLTEAERESLDLLVEEMGEALQCCGKMGRHGKVALDHTAADTRQHRDPVYYDNQKDLTRELGDVLAAVTVFCRTFDVDGEALSNLITEKLRRLATEGRVHHIDIQHIYEEHRDA